MKPTPGLACPTDPDHGAVLDLDGRTYCPNQAHDGRPKTHPDGPAPQSSPFRSPTIVDYSKPAPAGFTFQHVSPATMPATDALGRPENAPPPSDAATGQESPPRPPTAAVDDASPTLWPDL